MNITPIMMKNTPITFSVHNLREPCQTVRIDIDPIAVECQGRLPHMREKLLTDNLIAIKAKRRNHYGIVILLNLWLRRQ